jgi:hypothetical protein
MGENIFPLRFTVMELEEAVHILKKIVKNNSTNGENHFDLTLVPAVEKPLYVEALKVSQQSIKDGVITKDDFLRRVHIEG